MLFGSIQGLCRPTHCLQIKRGEFRTGYLRAVPGAAAPWAVPPPAWSTAAAAWSDPAWSVAATAWSTDASAWSDPAAHSQEPSAESEDERLEANSFATAVLN